MESKQPDIKMLSHFAPLGALSQEQLQLLASIVELKTVPSGTRVIHKGSNEDCSYFLVSGRLKLIAADGKSRMIDAEDESARAPIAQLRPRMYDVDALTTAEYLCVESHLLIDIHKSNQSSGDHMIGYMVSDSSDPRVSQEFSDTLANHLMSDLDKDQLALPSLPDVAIRIGRALKDEVSDAETIASIVQRDPVITAKLIKASNSAIYGRRVPVETAAGAVVRLGSEVTHKLVISYAMKELFKSSSGFLKKRMQALWVHSTKVAAICYVLAKLDKCFDPEHALLVGLLHDIGTVPIITYASTHKGEIDDAALDQTIGQLKGQIGSLILTKWGFSSDMVTAAADGEQWLRDTGGEPDYCDLVIAAQLHSYIGMPEAINMPALDQIPAHKRLGLGELTPRMSLKILEQAKEQIAHAEALLNM